MSETTIAANVAMLQQALADLDAMRDSASALHEEVVSLRDEVGRLRDEQRRVGNELDLQGAPPGPALAGRVRALGGLLVRARERVSVGPQRRRLPDERESVTHKFRVGGVKGHVTVGKYEDGPPGEVFLTVDHRPEGDAEVVEALARVLERLAEGPAEDAVAGVTHAAEMLRARGEEHVSARGFAEVAAILTSLLLQYGVPLGVIADKLKNTRFAPRGFTSNPEISTATSIPDYVMKWMTAKFPEGK